MQSLRFNRISICSEREQKALSLELHPRKTLFLGQNSTGKSTLVKSLFRAFDAEPTGELRNWDYNAIIAVDFSVNGRSYTSIRRGDLNALFGEGNLIGATTDGIEWSDIFAAAVGFKLQLMDQEERFRTATPSMFFLPFYVNQDGSFFGKWDTFKSIKQFDAYAIPHALEYFARVRPPKYFELKGAERTLKFRHSELSVEESTLRRTKQRLRRALHASPVKLTSSGFEKEVHMLAHEATELGAKQSKVRKEIVEYQELARQLEDQIRLSDAALREHEADFRAVGMAINDTGSFRCPTCHAEHEASFHAFLDLAEDARELFRLKGLLERNLVAIRERLTRVQREAGSLKQHYLEVSSLLATKRGRLTFGDVVKSYGADAADGALDNELETVQKEISLCDIKLRGLKTELETVMSAHDSDQPLKNFRERFKEFLPLAHVDKFEGIDAWKLNKRPTDSGSPGPRAVIAYYGALWSTMQNQEGELPCPLVIDSPNQNAQDRHNLRKV